MIDESTLYWLTRMDHLREMMSNLSMFLCIVGTIGAVVSVIIKLCAKDGIGEEGLDRFGTKLLLAFLSMAAISLCLYVTRSFTPTTKEQAVIKVLPVVASDQNIGLVTDEAKEIYGLAKQWLTDAAGEVGGVKPEKSEKEAPVTGPK